MEWFKPQPLPWQAGGGQALAPNPWTGQPNSGMPLPNMGPAPTWGVGPQPDMPAWPQALGGAPNWQADPMGQQGPEDDPIAQILEVTSTTPPEHAPDFISFMRQQDPHDVGMALALFQQSFTDPQGALQWAFQLKQSRDAQRARMEQAKVEGELKRERDKQQADEGKLKQAYAKATQAKGFDVNAWEAENGPLTSENYSKFMGDMATARAKTEKAEKAEAGKVKALMAIKSGLFGLNNVPKELRDDPDFQQRAIYLMGENEREKVLDNELKELRKESLKTSTDLNKTRKDVLDRLTPQQKTAMSLIDLQIGLLREKYDANVKALQSDQSMAIDALGTRPQRLQENAELLKQIGDFLAQKAAMAGIEVLKEDPNPEPKPAAEKSKGISLDDIRSRLKGN